MLALGTHSNRPEKRLALLATLVLASAVPTAAYARELLPFPSQQRLLERDVRVQQEAPPPDPPYVAEFNRALARMKNCDQVRTLGTDLARDQKAATTDADRDYFARLLASVERRKRELNCR